MADLHVFTLVLGPDTVVARDAEDAWAVWCEHTGEDREAWEQWEQIDDAKAITIGHEDAPPPHECPHGCGTWAVEDVSRAVDSTGHHPTCPATHHTKTNAEWASHGRGFLCSTEW